MKSTTLPGIYRYICLMAAPSSKNEHETNHGRWGGVVDRQDVWHLHQPMPSFGAICAENSPSLMP